MSTFNERFERFSNSVLPAMYEHHAAELGVSASAIERLPAGYDYKYQAWVYPERTPRGDIIGLSYRYEDGRKTMAPGHKNKRGLIYPFNQNYGRGEERYMPGRHNFRRISDVGVECPVCGKPDWCLVSAEDIADPQAVICGRVEKGSVKEVGGGSWLHVRKASGRVTKASKSVLPDTDLPILIVEGASDVLAGLSMGFIVIGRPNSKVHPMLSQMPLAGLEVWVVGENDAGAGIEGMEETYALVQSMTPKAKMVLPPDGIKDLRAWYEAGLTQEALTEYVEQYGRGVDAIDAGVLADGQPATIARSFANARYKKGDSFTLRDYRGDLYEWSGSCYGTVPASVVRGEIYEFLESKKYMRETVNGTQVLPCPTTRKTAYDVIDCLNMPSLIPVRKQFPCWLRDNGMPDPKNLIVFPNGLLDVNEYMEGRIKFYDPSPDLFVMHTFPYEFDEDADCQDIVQYFEEIFDGDKEVIRLLRQWFGYNCVPDPTMEKALLLSGPTRSGKSTTIDIMRAMLGEDQCCSVQMTNLSSRFGRAVMLGKLAATLSDAKSPRASEQAAALETLLAIIGQDPVSIDRKNLPELTSVRLFCRFTMAMNGIPEFSDNARALNARMNMIEYRKSYAGKEDRKLKPHLVEQAASGKLVNWALGGLKDLRRRGGFTEPVSSLALRERMENANTPLIAFVRDCCILQTGSTTNTNIMYDVYKGWCSDQGYKPMVKERFGRRLLNACLDITKTRKRTKEGVRENFYQGVQMVGDAIERYAT